MFIQNGRRCIFLVIIFVAIVSILVIILIIVIALGCRSSLGSLTRGLGLLTSSNLLVLTLLLVLLGFVGLVPAKLRLLLYPLLVLLSSQGFF